MTTKYKYDGAIIKVVNWEKYNPRSDAKKPSWFRLNNNFLSDFVIYSFNLNQKLYWIALLSQISEKNNSNFRLSFTYLKTLTKISAKKQSQAIEIFKKHNLITCEDVRDTHATNDTNDTNERNDTLRISKNKKPKKEKLPAELSASTEPKIDSKSDFDYRRTWDAYKEAYAERWGSEPPWNARQAGQLKHFMNRIPKEDAPHVIRFYLSHNQYYYVASKHPLGALLKDAEKIYTEWKTGVQTTNTVAREADKRSANEQTRQAIHAMIDRGEL